MNPLQGTIKHGHIILDVPAALPEGTRVVVLPINDLWPMLGMRKEDWPTTPEAIAALLAADGADGAGVAVAGRRRRLASGLACAERIREDRILGRGRKAKQDMGMTRFLLDTGSARRLHPPSPQRV